MRPCITHINICVMSGKQPHRLEVICGPESSEPVMAAGYEVEAMIAELHIEHGVVVPLVADQVGPGEQAPQPHCTIKLNTYKQKYK